jgi:endonuclease/exonuclease/phosphatase family metal-dependent hydrolase
LCYAFVAEFEELHSPLRRPDTQGGGLHGQAILSKFPLVDARPLVHSHQPVDWDAEGCVNATQHDTHCCVGCAHSHRVHRLRYARREARREPRRGKRVALAAVAVLPPPLGRVLVYSLHLEVFTGITGRLLQFAGTHHATTGGACCSACHCFLLTRGTCLAATDVLQDARAAGLPARQVIMGDLNTMAHRFVRPRTGLLV